MRLRRSSFDTLRMTIRAFAVFLACVPVAAYAQTGPGDAGIYTTTLRNGLRVIAVEDRAAPVVQTSVWYGFGSLQETPARPASRMRSST